METGKAADVKRPCTEFLARATEFYKVPQCSIRVLAARPLRVRENWTTELFGDYRRQKANQGRPVRRHHKRAC